MSDEVLIALFGLAATVVVAVASQWSQSRRERRRQEFDARERSVDRLYGHRKDAYANFISMFAAKHQSYFEHAFRSEPEPPDEWLDPLWDLLTEVKIFGSPSAHKHAGDALAGLASWIFGGKTPEGLVFANGVERDRYFENASHESFELLLTQARRDLGADKLGEMPAK